jgi:predicted Rossmann-fold nucleotide-binding protein
MKKRSPTRTASLGTFKLLRYHKRNKADVNLHGGALNTDECIRKSLGIASNAFVTTFFSGSRAGNDPNIGPIAGCVSEAIASSRHVTTMSGGGSHNEDKPDIKTGIMGWIAYGMAKANNSFVIITELLMGSEKISGGESGVKAICLVENGGAFRLAEREGALITPADFCVCFKGGVGTHSEGFGVITLASLAGLSPRGDRTKHRVMVLVNTYQDNGTPWQMQDKAFGGLIKTMRDTYQGNMINQATHVGESVLVYTPLPDTTKEQIAQDMNTLAAMAHFRASRISPDIVEPISPQILRDIIKPIHGQVTPVLFNAVENSRLENTAGWRDHLVALKKITRRNPLINRPAYYLTNNA